MSDFEEKIKNLAEQSVLKIVSEGSWIMPDYNNRIKIPTEFTKRAWELVDQEKVLKQLAELLEKELAERLVNALAAEIATDIKQVLSVKERREEVRAVVRENIARLTKVKGEENV